MTTYERIREIRNKMFPQELEFGVEVIDTEFGRNKIYNFGSMSKTFVFLHIGNKEMQEWKHNFEECYTILGLPISLNDILLMIGRKKKGNDIYAIKEDGKLIDVFLGENIYGGIQFDLTLPIKDQDEETLIKILSLIE